MLEGVTWKQFKPVSESNRNTSRFNGASRYTKNRVLFYAKYGQHMQRPVIAITAQGQFLHFVLVQPCPVRDKGIPIRAEGRHRQIPGDFVRQHLFTSDFLPDKEALTTLKGGKLSMDDLVLGEGHEN